MLPQLTLQGILPPYVANDPTIPDNMSPYRTDMVSFTQRFGSSPERLAIIDGLLNYRAQLIAAGLTGFQWLSGSFVEDVESIRGRPPKDIDVVSLVNRPESCATDDEWVEFLDSEQGRLLIDSQEMKSLYSCDTYAIDLNEPGIDLVNSARYWFGLLSHQRVTSVWKGMVVIELDLQQDEAARGIIDLANSLTIN